MESFTEAFERIHRELVERVVSELKPVRRLWPVPMRFAVWTGLETALALFFLCGFFCRQDLAVQARNPQFLFETAVFAAAGLFAAFLALRMAVPGAGPSRTHWIVLGGLVAAGVLGLRNQPVEIEIALGRFVALGLPCVGSLLAISLPPCVALFWAVRRGMVQRPLAAGLLTGGASFLLSFAIMHMACPIDEQYHLVVWHLGPVIGGAALSMAAGALWMSRRCPKSISELADGDAGRISGPIERR